jgi:pSer/pThr/pTyr-binding forkhead associated (FHA) protein
MAYFQLGAQQLQLKTGSQKLGPEGTGEDLRLPAGDATATAIVVVNPDLSVFIRKADASSSVRVNRVQLGAEPLPLMHGDHVEIGGQTLRFGDTQKAGSTQFISGAELAEIAKARAAVPYRPTLATGGRLISLVDGREYSVPDAGITIGRDPSADVVVAATQVSRRHVQITPGEQGYLLVDLSTNGVWVNEGRVAGKQVLGKGDIIKIADEEFRFYADPVTPTAAGDTKAPAPVSAVAVTPAPPPPQAAPQPVTPPATPAVPVAEPTPASSPVAHTPRPVSRPALATLEVLNDGPDKGQRIDVFSALTNVGRGEHNDLVLRNESVSDSHAKLQKREGGWYIVDVDSTNGTYVGGRRVKGEQLLTGAPDLRFGDVKVAFRPSESDVDEGKSTRIVVGVSVEEARRLAAARNAAPTPPRSVPAPESEPEKETVPAREKSGGGSVIVWLLLLVLLAGVAYFLYIGRTP